ncbi:ScbR family autoregulator-binding transcription factor [Kitasatospora sp. NPDC006697]|uniref:ScbR family autoregulator-binding transcription factor n=1 Tax=Kitasatospora sp. NPDC006697 TaxID=3364020 RepID=UPI003698CB11
MQAKSERTRRKLVRAGAETFDRHGYASATLGQIAENAGVTKGALYFHFGSKSDLADAVQLQGSAMLRDFLDDGGLSGRPPVQLLIDLTHWLAQALHEDPVTRAGCRIGSERAGQQQPVADLRRLWIDEVVVLLARAREGGELRRDAVAEGPETLLSAAVCGIEVLAGSGLSLPELRRKVAALWESLLPALVPPGDLGRYRAGQRCAAGV